MWTCHGDKHGKHTCERTQCVPGTHPSPCGACVPDGGDDCDCVPPKDGGCWVTGGGFVTTSGRDNFGGNAKPRKDGTIQGQWNHVDHGGRHVHVDAARDLQPRVAVLGEVAVEPLGRDPIERGALRTQRAVEPCLSVLGPEAFVATVPPIVALSRLPGSGP